VAVVKPEAQGERKKWAKSLPLPFIARPPLAQCPFMDAFALATWFTNGLIPEEESEE
jgi:hypothetical protein